MDRFRSISKKGRLLGNKQDYESPAYAMKDILVYPSLGKEIFAVERQNIRANLLVDFLNYFGEEGGFNLIIESLKGLDKENIKLGMIIYIYIYRIHPSPNRTNISPNPLIPHKIQ